MKFTVKIRESLDSLEEELVGSFSKVSSGGTPNTKISSYWDKNDVLWLSSGEVENFNIRGTKKSISNEGLKKSSAKLLPKNCVLIALAGQGKTRGKVGINRVELSTNQSVAAIKTEEKVNHEYLFFNLKNRYKELREISGGDNGRGGLTLEMIKSINVLVLPIIEQNNIAEILSTQESIIEDIKSLIEKNEKRLKYLSSELLSGRIRVKEENGETIFYKNPEENWKNVEMNGEYVEIPSDWESKKFKNEIKFTLGNTPKKIGDNYAGDLPWVTISNLCSKFVNEYTALIKRNKTIKIVPQGSLLGSFKMSIGKFGFAENDLATNEAIISISPNGTANDLNYLFYILPKTFIKNATPNGQGVPLLNTKSINNIELILPSLVMQKQISGVLVELDNYIEDLNKLLAQEEKRFQWLLDNLMSGKYIVTKEED